MVLAVVCILVLCVALYYLKNKTVDKNEARRNQLKESLIVIFKEASKYLDKGDEKINALKDYQLILGVTQVLWEDQIMKDLPGLQTLVQTPEIPKSSPLTIVKTEEERKQLAEMEFDQPEFMDTKKKVLH